MEMHEEGWYTDPFARHEERWMSNGRPTKLVRDQTKVSQDEPPDVPYVRDPQPVERAQEGGAWDVRRADDAEVVGPDGGADPSMMVWDSVWSDGAPFNLLYLDETGGKMHPGHRRRHRVNPDVSGPET